MQKRNRPTLSRRGGFAPRLSAALILAIGIGVGAALFTLYWDVLARPLPFARQDELVTIWASDPERDVPRLEISLDDLAAIRGVPALRGAAACSAANFGVVVRGTGEPVQLQANVVSEGFFRLLGVGAAAGRTFTPAEHRSGADAVAMLSHGAWQRLFGGDRSLVGRKLLVDGQPAVVVRVLPPHVDLPQGAEILFPFEPTSSDADSRAQRVLMARLAPGATSENAATQVGARVHALEERRPGGLPSLCAVAFPLVGEVMGRNRPAILALLAMSGLVLLTAAANACGILLHRGIGRRQEIAMRLALGARRRDLLRLFAREAAALASGAALAGAVLAVLLLGRLRRAGAGRVPASLGGPLRPGNRGLRPRRGAALHGRLHRAAVRRAAAAPLHCRAPARRRAPGEPRPRERRRPRRAGGRPGGDGAHPRRDGGTRRRLLPLAARHRAGLRDPRRAHRARAARLHLRRGARQAAAADARADGAPGGTARRHGGGLGAHAAAGDGAGLGLHLHRRGADGERAGGQPARQPVLGDAGLFLRHGHPPARQPCLRRARHRRCDSGRLAGRVAGAPTVGLARGGARQAAEVGQGRLREAVLTVVGVVADVRYRALTVEKQDLYLPYTQTQWSPNYLVVRSRSGNAKALLPEVRRVAATVYPEAPLSRPRTTEELVDAKLAQPRLDAVVLALFTLTALLLAGLGIYAVLSYLV